MTALIDGDSILYKVGFALEEEFEDSEGTLTYNVDLANAKDFIDGMLDGILFNTDCDDMELWLGERGTNFRYAIASESLNDGYKHNRKANRKPDKYPEMLAYIKDKYASMSPLNCEVDDVVCYKLAEKPKEYTLCAIDKDVIYQSTGRHYNYGTDSFITVEEGFSIWFAYYQTLIGDTTDGYKGCKLIGPSKAIKALGIPESGHDIIRGFLTKAKVKPEAIDLLLLNSETYSERQLWARVLTTYRKKKMLASEALATMRLAQMHQLKRNKEGKLRIHLWTPVRKGEERIDVLQF